jgi:LmbE family N-acetylglucosaminyl deacetylase
LLGRTLVLVAHPDDEAVGCGALLQRIRDPIVVFGTDGAPQSGFFWTAYGSRQKYAEVRAREAQSALNLIGVTRFHFLCEDSPIADQELFLQVPRAFGGLASLIETEHPQSILSLAYEGGHPDHDACSFLASLTGRQYKLPVWEMPLYRLADGKIHYQSFIDSTGEIKLTPSASELIKKKAMFDSYASQSHVLSEFCAEAEYFRPMPEYDFSRPPHPGCLNYEAWQWPMTSSDLCRAFRAFSAARQPSTEEEKVA